MKKPSIRSNSGAVRHRLPYKASGEATVSSASEDQWRWGSSDGAAIAARLPACPVRKFHFHDPDELLHHFNSLNQASYREVVPLGRASDLSFHKVEVDFGRVRLALVKCTPLIVRGPRSPRKLLVLVSEEGTARSEAPAAPRRTAIAAMRRLPRPLIKMVNLRPLPIIVSSFISTSAILRSTCKLRNR